MSTGKGAKDDGKRGPSNKERLLVFGIPILIAVLALLWLYVTHKK